MWYKAVVRVVRRVRACGTSPSCIVHSAGVECMYGFGRLYTLYGADCGGGHVKRTLANNTTINTSGINLSGFAALSALAPLYPLPINMSFVAVAYLPCLATGIQPLGQSNVRADWYTKMEPPWKAARQFFVFIYTGLQAFQPEQCAGLGCNPPINRWMPLAIVLICALLSYSLKKRPFHLCFGGGYCGITQRCK